MSDLIMVKLSAGEQIGNFKSEICFGGRLPVTQIFNTVKFRAGGAFNFSPCVAVSYPIGNVELKFITVIFNFTIVINFLSGDLLVISKL